MFTQCPQCNNRQAITVKELRVSRGNINCNTCSSAFNALEHLNDDPVAETNATTDFLPSLEAKPKLHSTTWISGVGSCLILLAFQVYYFESYMLTQNSSTRPWLIKTCDTFNCQIPPYKNLNEFTVLHGSFEPRNNYYVFETTYTNQANFTQNHPSIKLTLINFSGQTFAERIFHPEDYLEQTQYPLEPEMSAEITLNIATPSSKIGGYRFELI